jgi:hypothetical protein
MFTKKFARKVALDFARSFLGFFTVALSAALIDAAGLVNTGDWTVASWKVIGVALLAAAGSAAPRAAQALWTNLEPSA